MATNILMPALSPTMEEGKLAKWLVKEGDTVKSGDILAEIETDKATMEFEAVDEGRIGKILVPEGSEGVKVNAPIAVLLGEGEKLGDVDTAAAPSNNDIAGAMKDIQGRGESRKPRAERPRQRCLAAPARRAESRWRTHLCLAVGASRIASRRVSICRPLPAPARAAASSSRMWRTPSRARRSPPLRQRRAAAAGGAGIAGVAPLPDARLFYKAGDYEEIPHDSMRKAIAKRLTSAKTLIPHYYLTIDCNLDQLMAVREKLNAAAPKGKTRSRPTSCRSTTSS